MSRLVLQLLDSISRDTQWLFMRNNFAFLGMHLVINKRTSLCHRAFMDCLAGLLSVYANSIMASLNARKSIAGKVSGSERGYPLPVILPHPQSPRSAEQFVSMPTT